MARRVFAGGIGVVVAFGYYAVVPAAVAAPSRVTRAAPMQASAVKLPVSSISVVNPTPVRLVIPSISVDASIEARGLDWPSFADPNELPDRR